MRKILMFAFVLAFLALVAWADENDKDQGQKRTDDSDMPSYAVDSGNSGGMLLGGGPDAFGYRWLDSNDPGGPTFSWIDISGVGIEISPWPHGSNDDGYTDPILMGLTFNFYGADYDSIVVTTNGWVSLMRQVQAYYNNVAIPNVANPNLLIAPYWDDQEDRNAAQCFYYHDVAENRFIVSWINWEHHLTPYDVHSFQVVLDADDNSILFQYGDGIYTQTDITVGIENETGTVGLQVAYNVAYPANNLATRFLYSPPDHDIVPTVFIAPPGSGMINDPIIPQVTFTNLGANSETNVPVRLTITPGVYNDVQAIPSIDPLGTYDVSFASFTPTSAQVYTLTAIAELGSDVIPSNDTLRMSYAVFDQIMDFEASDGGFEASGDWEWGIPTSGPNGAYSGVNCWATNLEGNYVAGLSFLQFPLEIGTAVPSISFTHWYDTEARYDGGNFAVSTDDGSTWNVIEPFDRYDTTGNSSNPLGQDRMFTGHGQKYWEVSMFPLSDYAGQVVLARLGFGADASVFYPGWYVDDMGFIDCSVLRPANDVELVSIDGPIGQIVVGQSYPVTATIRNRGSNNVSFNVNATDNRAYSNTQTVTDLPPDAFVQVTFADWTIDFACSTYILAVTTQLAGDEDPSNDSKSSTYLAMPVSNSSLAYDDGIANNAWRFYSPSNYIANEFEVPYLGATLQAVTFKFSNNDDLPTWPDSFSNDVRLMIFIDEDLDGLPDAAPVYEDTLTPPRTGVTVWPIGCQTTLTLNCQTFWAAWTTVDSLGPEGIVVDALTDHPDKKWAYLTGVWQLYDPFPGDNMIRAYINGNFNQSAEINVASTSVVGSAQPGAADTVGNAVDNAAGECELKYSVEVVQDIFRRASPRPQPKPADYSGMIDVANPDASLTSGNAAPIKVVTVTDEKGTYTEPIYPPVIQSRGGPDAFGYIWIDSDEPGGPAYNWVDITTLGDSITWDTCSSTFGCEDEGISVPIPLGFTFNYYGISYTEVTASSNGFISFLPLNTWYTANASIPSGTDPNAIVAAMWDDLDGLAGPNPGTIYFYHDVAQNKFIVSWVDWGFYIGTNNFSMQVILDGNNNSIETQYNGIFDQTDYTVGIENHDGTDGLQVAYNAAYVHDQLALFFYVPTLWLSTDLVDGVLPAGAPPQDFDIFMDAAELDPGTYTGAINILSNDPDEAVTTIDVLFVVGGGPGCQYIPGDINNNGDVNGVDVGYGVNYFKGFGPPPTVDCGTPVGPCPEASPFYAAGDVNANCTFNGVDITYFVNYLKGIGPALSFCSDCPPAALAAPGQVTPTIQPSKAKVIQLER